MQWEVILNRDVSLPFAFCKDHSGYTFRIENAFEGPAGEAGGSYVRYPGES